MILKDRVSDIYQNYSLCEKGCEYESFDVEKLYVKCNCKIKQNISNKTQESNFKKYILSSFLSSNFGIIKCYNLVFGTKRKNKKYRVLVIWSNDIFSFSYIYYLFY